MNDSTAFQLDRREAVKWVLAAAAGLMANHGFAAGVDEELTPTVPGGYGTDPDLTRIYHPGDLWPLTLTPAQRQTTVALVDLILPADAHGPAASSVGVPDIVDEWISAPYPAQRADRKAILAGLAWIDAEAQRRFGSGFSELIQSQQAAIARDICDEGTAAADFKVAARFFRRFRALAGSAYYTSKEGMKDLGYVGNVPSATFEGPPIELIRKLGLEE